MLTARRDVRQRSDFAAVGDERERAARALRGGGTRVDDRRCGPLAFDSSRRRGAHSRDGLLRRTADAANRAGDNPGGARLRRPPWRRRGCAGRG